ncbi:dephospho-CoA kinase [Desulfosoma sp.]
MPGSKSSDAEPPVEVRDRPVRIALTGGIASGKSTVARMLAEKGAVVLDADEAARRAVRPGQPAWVRLREILGPDFFDPARGELKRRKLRERIIRDEALRSRVNAAVHPAVLETMEAAWRDSCLREPTRPVIFDIPLLYEAKLEEAFDCVVLAYADPEIQVRRLHRRDGVSLEEARKTLTMQLPIQWKRRRAHVVIDNSGDLESTRRQVDALWEKLMRRERLCRKDTPTTWS